jgi:hypothetical protein
MARQPPAPGNDLGHCLKLPGLHFFAVEFATAGWLLARLLAAPLSFPALLGIDKHELTSMLGRQ